MKNNILFILCFFLSTLQAVSQDFASDIELIQHKSSLSENEFAYYKRVGNNRNIMQSKHHTFFSKINPIANVLKAAMYLYQNVISAQLSKECPYELTCSNFSKQAIKKFGLFKGVFISADRITRCNRIALLDVNTANINQNNGSIKDPLSKYCAHE